MHIGAIVTSRFRGPPNSGNGGYVAGILGAHVAGPSRVRLHVPAPLERALAIDGEAELRLSDGEALIATCTPVTLELEAPPPPTVEEARAASDAYVGLLRAHPFPSCFVCGPERADGDGLRIFPGRTAAGLVAAPFEPPRDLLAKPAGILDLPIVWAALDCTGYFAIVGDDPVPMLLGEMSVEVRGPVDRGPHVVYGWSLGGEGRKARCGTALASADGRLLAVALATWIRPKDA